MYVCVYTYVYAYTQTQTHTDTHRHTHTHTHTLTHTHTHTHTQILMQPRALTSVARDLELKASYTSSLRPHTRVAYGLIH